jgi:heme o synthase
LSELSTKPPFVKGWMMRVISLSRQTSLAKPAPWRDYVSLTKPRVISLLLFATLVALFLASDGLPSLATVLWTMAGGYLAAGGAGAVNCYLDRDVDALMSRTCHRAIPMQRLSPRSALRFGLLLCILSMIIMYVAVNPVSMLLVAGGIFFYLPVYTIWLKRRTPQNVVIGGLAGAFPPLVGWAAASGTVDPMALLLAAIVFCWTPPHFWALALMRREDYAQARVPMLPVVRGGRVTRRQILHYAILVVLLSIAPLALDMGVLYATAALALGGLLLFYAIRLLRQPSYTHTRRFYFYSLFYLGGVLAAMLFDHFIFMLT